MLEDESWKLKSIDSMWWLFLLCLLDVHATSAPDKWWRTIKTIELISQGTSLACLSLLISALFLSSFFFTMFQFESVRCMHCWYWFLPIMSGIWGERWCGSTIYAGVDFSQLDRTAEISGCTHAQTYNDKLRYMMEIVGWLRGIRESTSNNNGPIKTGGGIMIDQKVLTTNSPGLSNHVKRYFSSSTISIKNAVEQLMDKKDGFYRCNRFCDVGALFPIFLHSSKWLCMNFSVDQLSLIPAICSFGAIN